MLSESEHLLRILPPLHAQHGHPIRAWLLCRPASARRRARYAARLAATSNATRTKMYSCKLRHTVKNVWMDEPEMPWTYPTPVMLLADALFFALLPPVPLHNRSKAMTQTSNERPGARQHQTSTKSPICGRAKNLGQTACDI